MKHKHHWLFVWFHEDCAPCWVRRFRYGYRLDPIGYMHDRNRVMYNAKLSSYERLYILNKCKPIEIEYD